MEGAADLLYAARRFYPEIRAPGERETLLGDPFPVAELLLSLLARGSNPDLRISCYYALSEPSQALAGPFDTLSGTLRRNRSFLLFPGGTPSSWTYSSGYGDDTRLHHWLPPPEETWPLIARPSHKAYAHRSICPVGPHKLPRNTTAFAQEYDHTTFFKDLLDLLLRAHGEEHTGNYAEAIMRVLRPDQAQEHVDLSRFFIAGADAGADSAALTYSSRAVGLASRHPLWWEAFLDTLVIGAPLPDGFLEALRASDFEGERRLAEIYRGARCPRLRNTLTAATLCASRGPALAILGPHTLNDALDGPMLKLATTRDGVHPIYIEALRHYLSRLDRASLVSATRELFSMWPYVSVGHQTGGLEETLSVVMSIAKGVFRVLLDATGDIQDVKPRSPIYMRILLLYEGPSRITLAPRMLRVALWTSLNVIKALEGAGIPEEEVLYRLSDMFGRPAQPDPIITEFANLLHPDDPEGARRALSALKGRPPPAAAASPMTHPVSALSATHPLSAPSTAPAPPPATPAPPPAAPPEEAPSSSWLSACFCCTGP